MCFDCRPNLQAMPYRNLQVRYHACGLLHVPKSLRTRLIPCQPLWRGFNFYCRLHTVSFQHLQDWDRLRDDLYILYSHLLRWPDIGLRMRLQRVRQRGQNMQELPAGVL
jgi:hypothetical protein